MPNVSDTHGSVSAKMLVLCATYAAKASACGGSAGHSMAVECQGRIWTGIPASMARRTAGSTITLSPTWAANTAKNFAVTALHDVPFWTPGPAHSPNITMVRYRRRADQPAIRSCTQAAKPWLSSCGVIIFERLCTPIRPSGWTCTAALVPCSFAFERYTIVGGIPTAGGLRRKNTASCS